MPDEGSEASRRILSVLLLAGAIVALLGIVLTIAIPPRTRFLALLNNAGHAPVFGAVAWLLLRVIAFSRRPAPLAAAQYGMAFAGTVALGLVVEVIQHFAGRDAAGVDVLMDAAGAGFVLCVSAMRNFALAPLRSGVQRRLLAGALLSAVVVAAPLAQAALAYARREAIFPDLARFDRPLDRYFLREGGIETALATVPKSETRNSGTALLIRLGRDHTPGLRLFEPKSNWRGYSFLKIGIVNPGRTPLRLVVRVHDALHDQQHEDRFNRAFTIDAGASRTLEIPLLDIEGAPRSRKLDLSRIAGVGIFEGSRPAPVGAMFYITRIWLE